jgi:glutathione synthase/RimK-type ligase-like ATP-grasp enzyme
VNASPAAILPLMMGIPDDRMVSVFARGDGGLGYNFLGNSRLATLLAPRFKQRLLRVFFGPDIPLLVPPGLRDAPVVNAIADPDLSAIALRMLEEHVEANRLACFNHPAAVLGSSRDGVAGKLAGIEGVLMPRTIRLHIGEPADIERAAEQHDLRWPLIVRVAGTHRGSATVRLDQASHAGPALRGLPWGGRDLYLTEYVEYHDADERYRKLRIVVVGGEIFLRHLIIADGWLVHVHDRRVAVAEEEVAALANFETELLPRVRARVHAIADALDMDYFGIDCNLRPDGSLLIFEANAMMDVLNNTSPTPNCWEAPIARIHDALAALLFDPARWRHPARRAVPA